MRRLTPKNKLYFIALALPVALAFFWSGRDAVQLVKNLRKIQSLDRLIEARLAEKKILEEELALLEKGDKASWKQVYRQEAFALLPNEIEYRFSDKE
ncbi:MAG: hypothetical protein HY747_06800 [Elusimicrobia bacterium]|nr:hypothetical protein [Elusimicrobiota bacterium]